jgi:hypothetical protein
LAQMDDSGVNVSYTTRLMVPIGHGVQTPGDIPLQPFRYCPTRQESHVKQADVPGYRLDGDRLLTGKARIEYDTTCTALIHPVSCISTV